MMVWPLVASVLASCKRINGLLAESQSSGMAIWNVAKVVEVSEIEMNPPRLLVPARHVAVPPLPIDQPGPPVALLQFAAGIIFTSGESVHTGSPPAPPDLRI